VDRARYARLLGAMREANMNMLRVWGGGLYESDDFYDLADELGLLVWQDFHFSCSLYPTDPPFLKNVAAEAEDAVRRLRNHPSLALWCGNNEIEAAWWGWGWKSRLPGWLWDDYQRLFNDLLPKAVAAHDPTRSYVSSSPSAEREKEAGDPGHGDAHYWGVWHAQEPFSKYEEVKTRFMSEYGFQSFPEMKTVLSFAGKSELALDSPVMLAHQKNGRGNMLIRDYLLKEYKEPKDFAAFLYLAQVQQAEGIKIGAEAMRRQRPRTMGSLYWQANDCWPVASWSGIDYYGRWKALHYYARRFYAPLLVSLSDEGAELGVWLVSDRTTATAGTLVARGLDFQGRTVFERRLEVTVPPLSSTNALRVARSALLAGRDPGAVFLQAELLVDGKPAATNRRFLVPMKDAALPKPKVAAEVVAADGGFVVRLSTDALARAVRLAYDPDDGRFEDNFVDLMPGVPVEIRYRPEGAVTLDAFRAGLTVTSLTDAFSSGQAAAP
jgi:beta-mannosidase